MTNKDNNINLKLLYVNITNHCNLKCRYCYDENSKIVDNSSGQSLDTYKKLAEDCAVLGLESVVITGGEPTINKNWFEICKLFYNKGIQILISTNGTLLTEDIIKKFKEVDACVQISLDGNEDTMAFITQVPGTYNKIMNSIQLLKKYNIDFNLNAVIGKHNLDSVDFLNELSAKNNIRIRLNFYKDVYNDGHGIIKQISITDIDNLIYKVDDFRKTNKNIFLNVPPLLTTSNMEVRYNPACGWAKNVAGVLANGDVTVCGIASCIPELVAGNIKNDSFYNIWNNSDVFNNLRRFTVSDLQGICKECPVNDICEGACRLEPYKANKNSCGPNFLCQSYYEALLNGTINKKYFPSKMLELS